MYIIYILRRRFRCQRSTDRGLRLRFMRISMVYKSWSCTKFTPAYLASVHRIFICWSKTGRFSSNSADVHHVFTGCDSPVTLVCARAEYPHGWAHTIASLFTPHCRRVKLSSPSITAFSPAYSESRRCSSSSQSL